MILIIIKILEFNFNNYLILYFILIYKKTYNIFFTIYKF